MLSLKAIHYHQISCNLANPPGTKSAYMSLHVCFLGVGQKKTLPMLTSKLKICCSPPMWINDAFTPRSLFELPDKKGMLLLEEALHTCRITKKTVCFRQLDGYNIHIHTGWKNMSSGKRLELILTKLGCLPHSNNIQLMERNQRRHLEESMDTSKWGITKYCCYCSSCYPQYLCLIHQCSIIPID